MTQVTLDSRLERPNDKVKFLVGSQRAAQQYAAERELTRYQWRCVNRVIQLAGVNPGGVELVFLHDADQFVDARFYELALQRRLIKKDCPK